jgi:hypothetical protein
MKRLLLAATMLFALASGATADIVRTLGGQNWTIADGGTLLTLGGVPAGNQVDNNPCIICGANQPNQTNFAAGFGYTDYGNTGHVGTYAFFSSGILRDLVLGQDTISAVNYSGAQLITLIAALGGQQAFGIGIDMNDTNVAQTLESFFFLDLTAHTVLAAFLPALDDGIALPSISNGTGFPDYLLNGLTTANLDPTHQYAFFARITGANDGPDSFFIVPAVVPGPVVGAGLPALFALGLLGFSYFRRRRLTA